MGFGFGNNATQEQEEQSDWANAFEGELENSSNFPLDFAKPDMYNALEST